MGIFLIYLIKSALCLALLYFPYTILLRNEQWHQQNRIFLLALIIVSFLFPLSQEKWFDGMWDSLHTAEANYVGSVTTPEPSEILMPEIVITNDTNTPFWILVCACIYFTGLTVSVFVRICQFIRMRHTMLRGCLWQENLTDGITLYCHARSIPPCSWMHSIAISEEDLNSDGGKAILMHEKAHVIYGHSYDTLLILIAETILWFNPIIWMIEKDLHCIHEYQADSYVLNHGIKAKNYQLYLIKKAVGSRLHSFANGLNQSTLKKRITMMCDKKSKKWAAVKYMYLLPLGAFAAVAFARPESANGADCRLEQLSAVKVTNLSAASKVAVTEKVNTEHLKIEKQNLTEEHPAEQNNLASKTPSALRTESRQPEQDLTKENTDPKEQEYTAHFFWRWKKEYPNKDQIYTVTDVKPSFPGGDAALAAYVAQKMQYPAKCLENGVTGRMLCHVVIDAEGNVCSVEIFSESSEAKTTNGTAPVEMFQQLAGESERIISGMPQWQPAMKDGKAVATSITLPITFMLQ